MKVKTFYNYKKACIFCDEVDGQIEWGRYRKNHSFYDYWIVWY